MQVDIASGEVFLHTESHDETCLHSHTLGVTAGAMTSTWSSKLLAWHGLSKIRPIMRMRQGMPLRPEEKSIRLL